MEKLLEGDHGLVPLIAGLIIILCLHLVFKVGLLIFEWAKRKSEMSDKNIEVLNKTLSSIENRMTLVERDLNEVLKFRHDFRRLFTAVKAIAGERWPEIKKVIAENDLLP